MVVESITRGKFTQANAGAAARPGGFWRGVTLSTQSSSIAVLAMAGRHNGGITRRRRCWDEVVRRIVEATGSVSGGLYIQMADAAHLSALCNADPFYADAFVQYYHKINPVNAIAAVVAPGRCGRPRPSPTPTRSMPQLFAMIYGASGMGRCRRRWSSSHAQRVRPLVSP